MFQKNNKSTKVRMSYRPNGEKGKIMKKDINRCIPAKKVTAYVCPTCEELFRVAPRCPYCGQLVMIDKSIKRERRQKAMDEYYISYQDEM